VRKRVAVRCGALSVPSSRRGVSAVIDERAGGVRAFARLLRASGLAGEHRFHAEGAGVASAAAAATCAAGPAQVHSAVLVRPPCCEKPAGVDGVVRRRIIRPAGGGTATGGDGAVGTAS
jgi:hypothetical protein